MQLLNKLRDILTVPEDEYDEAEMENAAASSPQQNIQPEKQSGKVTKIHSETQSQVLLVKAEKFEDAKVIVDQLREMHPIILNFESADKDVSRRILDFLAGAVYVYKGQLKNIAENVFLITPFNVQVIGDLQDGLQSKPEEQ